MFGKIKPLLTFLIGWPLSIIALFFIGKLITPHLPEFQSHLNNIQYWMIGLGILCFLIYYFLRSFVYKLILKFQGYTISLQESAFYWSQSEMHRYIPGNIWSFLGRTVLFSKKNIDKKDIGVSLIIENQLVLVGTLLLSLFCLPFLIRIFQPNLVFKEFFIIIIYFAVIVGTLLYIFSELTAKYIPFSFIKKIFLTPFNPKQNVSLLIYSAISYFFFGLGYYFIMASFIPLNLQLIFILISFFIFSLLIGYISFITPTGLGIREGIHLLGLKSFAPIPLIGIASILTRIILIISEFLYLVLSFIWQKIPREKSNKYELYIFKHRYEILLFTFILIYIIYFSFTSILRYDHFYTGRFDLGNMAQTVWNTIHGNFFNLTDPNGSKEVSRLAFHADFILILLSPLYLIWENPKMLLIIQSVVSGIGAIFVYLLSKKILNGKTLPLLLAILYLLNPSVQRANIYDFHAVTLATTFLLGAFYYLISKRMILFSIFLLLACLTKEQVWLIASFFGLYLIFFQKRIITGISVFFIGVFMFIYLIFFAIPNALGSEHFALSFYSDYGEKPGAIIKNVVLSPHKTIPLLFEKDRLLFYDQQLLPVGYLVLLSPLYLLFATGDLAIYLLSSNPQFRQIYYQYTATITPFIFLSAIYGIKRFEKLFPKVPRFVMVLYLLIIGVFASFQYGPLPGAKEHNLAMYNLQRKNAEEIDSYLQNIPKSYSVSSTNNAGSHLSHRKEIFAFPKEAMKADIVVLLTDSPIKPFNSSQKDLINRLKNDSGYLIFHEEKDFIVFKKMQEF